MKSLKEYIINENIQKSSEVLADLFKRTMLKGITLSDADFNKSGDAFVLDNISKDTKDATEFIKNAAASVYMVAVSTYISSKEYKVSIIGENRKEVYIKINADIDTNHLHPIVKNVISVEMSKEIKDQLV